MTTVDSTCFRTYFSFARLPVVTHSLVCLPSVLHSELRVGPLSQKNRTRSNPTQPNAAHHRHSALKTIKLDAGQSPALARPAVPLTTGMTKISSVDKPTKIGCYDNVSRVIKKTHFRVVLYSHSSTNSENLANIGPVGFEQLV